MLARDIKTGDDIKTKDGLTAVVSAQIEILTEEIKVYNFNVLGYHTYVIGSELAVVHNLNCNDQIKEGDYRATINPKEREMPHAHIFKKSDNLGRVFTDGRIDKSLSGNKKAMKFVKRHYDEIIKLIGDFYGKF